MLRISNCKTLLLSLLLLIACNRQASDSIEIMQLRKKTNAEIISLAMQTYPYEFELLGTVQPKQRTTVASQISAKVGTVNVVIGSHFKAGELLINLEAAEIAARVEQAQAAFQQAESDFKRISALVQQRASTSQDLDAIQAKERVTKASADEMKTLASYTKILAPYDGVVSQKFGEVGDIAIPGKPLLELISTGNYRIEADAPEKLFSSVNIGSDGSVVLDDNSTYPTKVIEISPVASSLSRSFVIRTNAPNLAKLFPGMFVRLRLNIGNRQALMIPKSAVMKIGQVELVYIIVNNNISPRLVRTSVHTASDVIVRSGLDSGESILKNASDVELN